MLISAIIVLQLNKVVFKTVVDISYGYYETPFQNNNYADASANIVTVLNASLAGLLAYSIDSRSGKSIFTATADTIIYFNEDCSANPDLNTPLPLKLGWMLGFRAGVYQILTGSRIYSEGIVSMASPKYIYICIK